MKDFGVLGSGIPWLEAIVQNYFQINFTTSCLTRHEPNVYDETRSNIKNLSFDHGAQYIHPKNKNFNKFISFLVSKKVLKKWSGNHLNSSFNKEKKKIKYNSK